MMCSSITANGTGGRFTQPVRRTLLPAQGLPHGSSETEAQRPHAARMTMVPLLH
jgi:hypothetical protein